MIGKAFPGTFITVQQRISPMPPLPRDGLYSLAIHREIKDIRTR